MPTTSSLVPIGGAATRTRSRQRQNTRVCDGPFSYLEATLGEPRLYQTDSK